MRRKPDHFYQQLAWIGLSCLSCALISCQTPQQKAARELQQQLNQRQQDRDTSIRSYESAMDAYHANRLEEAQKGLRTAVEAGDHNIAAWNALGVVAFHRGDIRTAMEAFQRAAQLSPGSYEPHFNLGTVFESIRRYPEAIGEYEAALALAPESVETQENLARVLIRSESNPERALELVMMALKDEVRPDWRKWLEMESIRLENLAGLSTFPRHTPNPHKETEP